MLDKLRNWLDGTGRDRAEILRRLTSDAVRGHKNKRIGDTSESTGHVHNAMLPQGGLQQVVASHNIHVVSHPATLFLCRYDANASARCSSPECWTRLAQRKDGELTRIMC